MTGSKAVVVRLGILRAGAVTLISGGFAAVCGYFAVLAPPAERGYREIVVAGGCVVLAVVTLVALTLFAAAVLGRPAIRLSDGEVSYRNPLPHKLPLRRIKRAHWLPDRRLVRLETDGADVWVSARIFARDSDGERIVQAINAAVERNPAALGDASTLA